MAASLSFFSSSIFLLYNSPTNKHNNNSNNKSLLPCPWRSSSSSIRSELKSATLPVLSFTGEALPTTVTLSLNSAPPSTARSVVHRALVHDQQNARRGTASTLTRAEVRGGGKKPYAQKKTGRARRGSQRTPLRPGGGVIFGPKPKDWSIKMNRKEKRLAISTAIASAIVDEDALVVVEDGFAGEFEKMGRPKTREFVEAMRRWGLDPKDKAMFLAMEVPDNVRLSCRNIGTVKMLTPRTLNLFDILDAEKLVFTKMAVDYLNAMYGENANFDNEDGDDEEIEKVYISSNPIKAFPEE